MTPSTRSVARDAIHRIVDEGGYSNLVVPAALSRSSFDARDRAFTADMIYGTVRHLRSIDWAIEQRANRPVGRMSPGARDALRLGTYQLLFGHVAPHAAVGETVALAAPNERSFVNAILRKLSTAPPPWPAGESDRDIAVRTGLDPWAIDELRHVLDDPAEVEVAAEAFAERGPLCLRTNRCATTPDQLLAALGATGLHVAPAHVHEDCLLVDHGDPTTFPGWHEGWFAVQDEASAFVVEAVEARPGDRVLDACAGPGGKAAHLACVVGDEGLVVGADLHPKRASLVAKGAARLGVRTRVLAQDATVPALSGRFDRVLVDAPCSGLGSSRRRPELLWRAAKSELSQLARLQVAIAKASAELLRPGGRLVYSVCTFPRAETDAACDAIVRHRPDLVPADVTAPDGSAAPRVRLWPHREGCDAMFVAAFTREP
jgi:16S rRNA (cytosine967-C5)-methyltransferase